MSQKAPFTLLDLLQTAATAACDHGTRYLDFDGQEIVEPYGALMEEAARLHGGLRASEIPRGRPVILPLVYPRAFLPLFWACQMRGCLPVPLAPPVGLQIDEVLLRLRTVCHKLGNPAVICEGALADLLREALGTSVCRLLTVESLRQAAPDWDFSPSGGEETALIQFSSGSTREPRGILLSHDNLRSNLEQFTSRIALAPDDVECDWMPLFHDLGLIGCHLGPLSVGAHQVKILPAHFLLKPSIWFETASRTGSTILSATNMALRYVLRRIPQVKPDTWDLSPVRMLMVGAEPVQPQVLRDFLERLAPANLTGRAVKHAYGLAEATLGVSVTPVDEPPGFHWFYRDSLNLGRQAQRAATDHPEAVELVDAGLPMEQMEVRIMDDQDSELPDGWVGHLQVRGPSVTRGYYQDESATRAVFSGSWLRTGDIGFRSDDRLFICGREKELITHGGSNYYPHDIEAIAAATPGVRLAVACSTAAASTGEERILLFVVLKDRLESDPAEILDTARRSVQRTMQIEVHQVICLPSSAIPRTTSGKIRRVLMAERYLRGDYDSLVTGQASDVREHATSTRRAPAGQETDIEPTGAGPATPSRPEQRDEAALVRLVTAIWADVLGRDPGEVEPLVPFAELGGTSIKAYEVLARLEAALGRALGFSFLKQCSTVSQMVAYLTAPPAISGPQEQSSTRLQGVSAKAGFAVIGMACRFPDADSPEEFWKNLAAKRSSVGPLPQDRWPARALDGVGCQVGSFIDKVYDFDADLFQIPPEEARILDPQQRLLLQLGFRLLEESGYGSARRRSLSIGVFVGSNQMPHQELLAVPGHRQEAFTLLRQSSAFRGLPQEVQGALQAAMDQAAADLPDHPTAIVGNIFNMIASRLSHQFDLTGPSLAVDTACSASLVSIHLACESLRRKECDLAIAGGINLNLSPVVYRYFEAAGALSHRGACRSFSREADGFVPGEGLGLVLLRPLDLALQAGDRIWGVIRGSAVNNDGSSIGVMAPNPRGQVAVLEAAYRNAGIDPGSVGLIEAHGTGTVIGDPIEIRSLTDFFGPHARAPIPLGTVKSNLGHLLGAAGVAGVIKLVLALRHRQRPPTLHVLPGASRLDDVESPLVLQTALEAWTGEEPRRGGVSAFGFGGTNAHLVVEEAPAVRIDADRPEAPHHLLALSAPTASRLQGYVEHLATELPSGESTAKVCAELSYRTSFRERRAKVVGATDSMAEALDALQAPGSPGWLCGSLGSGYRPLRIAYLFPGQGSLFLGQSAGLRRYWRSFGRQLETLASRPATGENLTSFLYGPAATVEGLKQTAVAQPLLVSFQVAMAMTLKELGIRPVAVIGHSVGEISAACAAGILSAQEAVELAFERGRLMQELDEPGGMRAVFTDLSTLQPFVEPHAEALSIACHNGPRQLVVAGRTGDLERLAEQLAAAGIASVPLPVSHGFHSPLMEPMIERFSRFLGIRRGSSLGCAFASTVTGTLLESGTLDADYWIRHARQPVRFDQAFSELAAGKIDLFLEIGPNTVLTRLASDLLDSADPRPVLPLCRDANRPDDTEDLRQALTVMAELWSRGAPLDLDGTVRELSWAGEAAERTAYELPTLPFGGETLRFPRIDWRPDEDITTGPTPQPASSLGPERLLHRVTWIRTPEPEPLPRPSGAWLLFADNPEVGAALAERLRGVQARPYLIRRSTSFLRTGEFGFAMDPGHPDHYRWLISSLSYEPLGGIVHLWSCDPPPASSPGLRFQNLLVDGLHSLTLLLRALVAAKAVGPLFVATPHAGAPPGDPEPPDPGAAAIAALVQSLYQEHPEVLGRVVDLERTARGAAAADVLWNEMQVTGPELVAVRGDTRWQRQVVTLGAQPPDEQPPQPPQAGSVHLILGGSGALGSAIARHLAATIEAPHLWLTGRRSESALGGVPDDLRGRGAIVTYRRVDLEDPVSVGALIAELFQAHPMVETVVHVAGSASLGSLAQRELSDVDAVLLPKTVGALALAEGLANRTVKSVVLVSSITGSVPPLTRGLADYAAANAFLDALASSQRRLGRPWTSVGYTLWQGAGTSVHPEAMTAGKQLGITPIPESLALQALTRAIDTGEGHVLVVEPRDLVRPADAENLAPRRHPIRPQSPSSPKWPPPVPTASSADHPAQWPERKKAVATQRPVDLPAVEESPVRASSPQQVEALLRRLLGQATDTDPDVIDLDAPFLSMGITSLTAVDMVKELEQDTGLKLSTTLLFEQDTLGKLLRYLNSILVVRDLPEPPTRAEDSRPTRPVTLPLLSSQKTFYANQSFYPDLPCYISMRLILRGNLEEAVLNQALERLALRHEALGLVFRWEGGELRQRLGEAPCPRVEWHDWRELEPRAQAARVDELEEAVRNDVFDLSRGPLYRLVVCHLEEGRFALIFNIHHIAADAWSAQLLVGELLWLQGEIGAGREPSWPPLRSDFTACATALMEVGQGDDAARSEAYWQEVLRNPPPLLDLPYDGDPRAETSGRCKIHQVLLRESATRVFLERAAEWNGSPFHLLFASYLWALQRWSGQTDQVVRVANARREVRLPDIERVVGSFADSLPIRVKLSGITSTRELVDTVRQACVEAQNHPLTSSLRLAGLTGDRDHYGPRGLSVAGLSYLDFPAVDRVEGFAVESIQGGSASGFTQLGLIAWIWGGRLHLSWNYTDGLFHPATIEWLAEDHRELLDTWVKNSQLPTPPPAPVCPTPPHSSLAAAGQPSVSRPQSGSSLAASSPTTVSTPTTDRSRKAASQASVPTPRSGIPPSAAPGASVLTAPSKSSLASPYPTTTQEQPPVTWSPLPPGCIVHERILDQISRSGSRTAVADGEISLTYSELGRAAASLARALGDGEKQPLIGILARPGAPAVIGVLGILCSGSAYVPMDPDYPDARLGQIARKAGIRTLVTTAHLRERVRRASALLGIHRVVLCDGPATGLKLENLPRVSPHDLAYVMFTSGTTGSPKGVMVSHRAVSLFHDWVHEAFGINPEDRFIQTSSLGFGGSIRQIFSPLLAGATVYPTPPGLTRDPLGLIEFLERHRISIWNSVPTLWAKLLDFVQILEERGRPVELPELRWILAGGENVPADLVRRWMDRFGTRHRIANLYGSTETVVNATWYEVTSRPDDQEISLPIGRARAGCVVAVADELGRRCPPGQVGEIWVGGESLASGYLNDDALTREAYTYLDATGGRTYRTGDLGVLDARGQITFKGRRDSQVKIRGNRVELLEIENVLASHPSVRAAAVVERRDRERQWLVAFVVNRSPEAPLKVAELRAHLEAHLPEYMVPHRFEACDRLPLTSAGKLDRAALTAGYLSEEASVSFPTGRPSTEEILATIWRRVLRLQRVDPDEDFFALGGDSILALEVFEHLRHHVPELPRPITLYQARTIRQLAARIDTLSAGRAPASETGPAPFLPSVRPEEEPYPLSATQEGFILAQRLKPDQSPGWCAEIEVVGRLDSRPLLQALGALMRRHPLLRTVFVTVGLKTSQRVLSDLDSPLTIESLEHLSPVEQESALARCFEAESRQVFDLASGPMFRVHIARLEEHRSHWFFTVHHAIGDAFSLFLLGVELLQLYDAILDGRPAVLPPLRASFRDVVEHLRIEASRTPDSTRAFWDEQYRTPWPQVRLRIRGTGEPAVLGDQTTSESLYLTSRESDRLRELASSRKLSLFALFLTLHFRVLARHSGEEDQIVGIATSGRDLPIPDIGRIFGCFATGLPIRARIRLASFEEDLRAVQKAFFEAYEHGNIPTYELAKVIPRHAGSPYPPGATYFMSFMDFRSLQAMRSNHLEPDWLRARLHYSAAATDTQLSFNVILGEQIRINLHSMYEPALQQEIRAEVEEEIEALLQSCHSPHSLPNRSQAEETCTEESAKTAAATTVQFDQDPPGDLVQHREPFTEAFDEPGLLSRRRRPHPVTVTQRGTTHTPVQAVELSPKLDAALICYLPASDDLGVFFPRLSGSFPSLVRNGFFRDRPCLLAEVMRTPLGVSGAIFVPWFADELLSSDRRRLAGDVAQAVSLARAHGALSASLAGLLPSCLGYGFALEGLLDTETRGMGDPPFRLTTGHAATVVAVVKNLRHVLGLAGLSLDQIELGIIGFGSIGQSALGLLLQLGPHPIALRIVEAADQLPHLNDPIEQLQRYYHGPLEIVGVSQDLPDAAYAADVLIGASSRGGILDVARLRPGTLLLDDSFPSLVDRQAAILRMERQQDVATLGAGMLSIGSCSTEVVAREVPPEVIDRAVRNYTDYGVPGCRIESLLVGAHGDLPAIRGLVEPEQAAAYWLAMSGAGVQPAPLHLGPTPLPEELCAAVGRLIRARRR
ncbi:MAG: amino acid adenylation domain-containing protein [Bradymonadales bacterium]|nr:amino acid adenylation domain-containing protein [Bradymonadales bacterium]